MSRTLFGLVRLLTKLRERDRWTRARLEAHQKRELGRLRALAYARSAFYRRFHAGLTNRPLRDLPVLTRATLMAHFDELVTDPSIRLEAAREHLSHFTGRVDSGFLGKYHVVSSPGTTGDAGVFLYHQAAWMTALAGMGRLYEWAGHRIRLTHRPKTATIIPPSPTHLLTQLATTMRRWGPLWPTLCVAVEDPVESMVGQLNAWRPEILAVYPSMARVLAAEQTAGRLRIAPRLVSVGSEIVTAEVRRRAAAAWGIQPFEAYGAAEMGGLAAECASHRGLHLMEDLAVVEVVDDRNRPVPPGEHGAKVLVSVFASWTQPLIRYEMTDSVRLAPEPCPCGRPFALIDSIRGRAEDVLRLPRTGGGEVSLWPPTFIQALDTLPVTEWQVLREAHGGLNVLLGAAPDGLTDEAVLEPLRRALADKGADASSMEVTRVASVPRESDGRAPLVLGRSPPPESDGTSQGAARSGAR